MKKLLSIALAFIVLQSCGDDGSNQGGVINDGYDGISDSDGALIDSTPNQPWDSSIDTSKGEHRVDIQQRYGQDSVQQ